MKLKLVTCGLCLGVLASAAGAGDYVKAAISFRDGQETIGTNPARGRAGGGWVTFRPEGLPGWYGQSGYHSSLWELSRFSGGREQGGKRPSPERVGGVDLPLTEAMKADVRRFLSETRVKGGSLVVRLGYTWSEQKGCEPGDFSLVLEHVRELSTILSDFEDVVVGVEAGIAGPWGEMHSSDYCQPKYMNEILKTYVDNLGAKIPVLVRSPSYFTRLAGTNAEGLLAQIPFQDRYLARLGMYNDGYLGTWWDYGTWAGDFTRDRGVQLLAANRTAPYGGEMAYVGRDWLARNGKVFDPSQWNLVREWYATHLNYLRNVNEKGHTLAEFIKKDLTFKTEIYAFEGAPDLSEYDGVPMGKFLTDHMGYRFVIRDARLPKSWNSQGEAFVALELENTGFGRLLLPVRAALVFQADDGVEVCPTRFALGELDGGQRKRLAMKFRRKGYASVRAAFLRVWCPCADEAEFPEMPRRPVRFANKAIWDETLKANRLTPLATP